MTTLIQWAVLGFVVLLCGGSALLGHLRDRIGRRP
jgi:MFS family permease